jgi:hypothetical protein
MAIPHEMDEYVRLGRTVRLPARRAAPTQRSNRRRERKIA